MAEEEHQQQELEIKKLLSSYMGLSFSLVLALLPNHSPLLLHNLHSQVRHLSMKLFSAEEELREMKSRRQEDSKANARVVDIFASHRNAWNAEEKRLLGQLEAAEEEVVRLRARVAELEEKKGLGGWRTRECYGVEEEVNMYHQHEEEENQQHGNSDSFDSEFVASASSNFWAQKPSICQDVQYESLESMYNTKHFVARRESPWKVDGDSAGVSAKLKLLEQEFLNLEKVGMIDLSKVSSLIKKQAKRYGELSEKIEDLCRSISSDPCEPSLSSEFRTQTQTEFLLEAFRLQQGASETGQKLMALQTEIGKNHYKDEVRCETTPTTKRSLDSIRNNFKKSSEIWRYGWLELLEILKGFWLEMVQLV